MEGKETRKSKSKKKEGGFKSWSKIKQVPKSFDYSTDAEEAEEENAELSLLFPSPRTWGIWEENVTEREPTPLLPFLWSIVNKRKKEKKTPLMLKAETLKKKISTGKTVQEKVKEKVADKVGMRVRLRTKSETQIPLILLPPPSSLPQLRLESFQTTHQTTSDLNYHIFSLQIFPVFSGFQKTLISPHPFFLVSLSNPLSRK